MSSRSSIHQNPHGSRNRIDLVLSSAAIGIIAGLVATFFRFLLDQANALRTILFALPGTLAGIIALFAILASIGYLTGLVTQNEPLISGSGIPQFKAQLLGYFSPCWWRVLIKKIFGGAMVFLCGLAIGREGPAFYLGSLSAKGFCKLTRRRLSIETNELLICGACAGLTAMVNAPFAAIAFALEGIHRPFSSRLLLPAMVSAICADLVSRSLLGADTRLALPSVDAFPLSYSYLYLLAGVLLGLVGIAYNKAVMVTRDLFFKTKLPLRFRVLVPFLAAGVVWFVFPEALGCGSSLVGNLSAGTAAISAVALLLAVKFAFFLISFCSGAPGGIFFSPILFGALVGYLFGFAAVGLFGMPDSCLLYLMLLGMAGLFAGVIRAPLTGVLLVVEMTGSLSPLLGLAVVSCLAAFVADLFGSKPVYDELQERITPDHIEHSDYDLANRVLDLPVSTDSAIANLTIREAPLPQSCLVISILRGDTHIIPHGDTRIEPGDLISILCPSGVEGEVRRAAASVSGFGSFD